MLSDVATSCLGKMLDRRKHTEGRSMPYLRNQNVRWFGVDMSDVSEMFFESRELDRYGLVTGDVLICEGGEPGRAAIWDGPSDMKFQKALHRVRPSSALLPPWLVLRLSHDAQSGRLDDYFTGTTIKHFTGTSLAKYEFPLPPLNEQRRIVAKLESLQARSRRAREALAKIEELEGLLVQSWTRPTHPVSALGPHVTRKTTEVGEGWREFPLVGLSNEGKIIERREGIGQKSASRCRLVEPGDIVFNPIRFSIGSVARYRGSEPVIVSPEYEVLSTRDTLSAELLVRYLRTGRGRGNLETETTGSVRYRVYFKDFARIPIPLAPPAEQANAERLLGHLSGLRDRVQDMERALDSLDRALLAKAFRGELVPQDPTDEPAADMLARLRAAEVATPPKPTKSRR